MSNIGNKNVFAKNLEKYMQINGKTRNDLCKALNLKYTTVSDWVNGKKYPRMDKVEMLANYFGILKSDLIEEKVTSEIEKNSDVMVDITVRMGSDLDFREVVKRICFDDEYFELNKMLCNLDSKQIESVRNMLSALL